MKELCSRWIQRLKNHSFMFTELVKRDLKQKYKRSILGMGWSVLSPLLQLLSSTRMLPRSPSISSLSNLFIVVPLPFFQSLSHHI